MDNQLEPIVKKLQADFGATVEEFRGEAHLTVSTERIVATLEACRDQFGFELLSAQTAVDYWPQESPRFHIVYQLTSVTKNLSVTIHVPVNGSQPEVPTACGVYNVANWREREIWDMFGIRFIGHPDPRRILNPSDADYHPLRKDYPLGYEEPQFSFNFDEIQLGKPNPKE
jgi:NADH-quinone oxidoreductase subunit C